MKPKKVELPKFKFVITIEDRVYTGEAATALDALQAISAPDLELISAGSVVVSHGDKGKEMFFSGIQMKRLFNPYNQEVLSSELASGM